jgi:hypothetical protein
MGAYEPKESPRVRRMLRRPLVDADLEYRRKFGCPFLAMSAAWAFAFVLPKGVA